MRTRGGLFLLLLALAAAADFLTGPTVAAEAFYVFPTACAAWFWGRRYGIAAAVVCSGLNILDDLLIGKSELPRPLSHILNPMLGPIVLLALAALTAALSDERNRLARLQAEQEADLKAARAIQDLLITGECDAPQVELATRWLPARITGGDVISVVRDAGDRLAIMIADVSGKGSSAALTGAVLLGMIETLPGRWESPGRVLKALNERLCGRLQGEKFISAFYAVLDLSTGRGRYASAGHEPVLLLLPDGMQTLDSTGMVLGVVDGNAYGERPFEMAPDSVLFGFTDGLTELRLADRTLLGDDGVRALVQDKGDVSCTALLDAVLARAQAPDTEILDDLALVAIRWIGRAAVLSPASPVPAREMA